VSAWADLLFGDGAILGFILINAVLLSISLLLGENGGLVSGLLGILLAFFYYENITANSFEIWLIIFQIIMVGIYFLNSRD
jgi:hypothetical protein